MMVVMVVIVVVHGDGNKCHGAGDITIRSIISTGMQT